MVVTRNKSKYWNNPKKFKTQFDIDIIRKYLIKSKEILNYFQSNLYDSSVRYEGYYYVPWIFGNRAWKYLQEEFKY